MSAAQTEQRKETAKRHLPAGWRLVRLEDVIQEAQGGFASGVRDPNGVIQLRMNNVTSRGQFDWSAFIRVPSDPETLETYGLKAGDVLFNNTNSTDLVGKSALFTGHEEPVTYSNHFTRLRTVAGRLLPAFLSLWLQDQWRQRIFANICNRWIGQSAVQRDKLLSLQIPLPSIVDQQRIAAILTEQMAAVDRARSAAEAQLKAAKTLPVAYLRDVFNSPQAYGWPRKRIGDVSQVQSGYAFKSDWFAVQGIRLLRNANVFQGFIAWDDVARLPLERRDEFKAFELNAGDIVLSLDRPVVKGGLKVARLSQEDVPSLLLQRVGRIQLIHEVDADYLFAFLNSTVFISAITGHDQSLGVPHVSPKQVEDAIFPCPTLPEQRRIATCLREKVAEVARASTSLKTQVAAINALPSALLRQAFSGGL